VADAAGSRRTDLRVGVLRHTVYRPSERFIPDQVLALPDCDPVVVTRDAVIDPVPGLRTVRMPLAGRLTAARYVALGWTPPLERVIREERLELLHAHFGVEGSYAVPAARKAGVPHLVTLHGFDVSYSTSALLAARTVSWARYAFVRKRLLAATPLVCVSQHVARLAVALGADEGRITVLPTGVDVDRLTPTPVPETPRIVHVARLVEKKGTSDLIAAVDGLRRELPDVRLDVLGDGPLRGELERQVRELGIERHVVFAGATPHAAVLQAVRDAAVVAVPSVTARSGDTEGLPQVVLEAGALGRPVVGTVHAGIPEAVDDGTTGLLVPERAPIELAAALRAVLTDHALAERLGSAARDRIVTDFSLAGQSAKLRDLYGRLVG
jgi:colanic acid/amylovoran biosynthesis glycosyltransferase